ncbi:MAG: response regulator transcription factor [Thermodesulfobacteriota bacterium]
MSHILVVEDEAKIREVLRDYLKKEGHQVSCLERGDTVIPTVKKSPPDLILLDVMLPGMDGLEVCRGIRKFSRIPILMLTARVEEVDCVLGLELGADDYICKPFRPREVMARIKAVLRRTRPPEADESILRAGPIELNVPAHDVTIDARPVKLTPIEFNLLRLLMENPGRAFSRSELVSRTQGYDFDGYDRTIDTHIKNLRRKIAATLPGQEVIASVHGVGYKLAAGR